MRNGLTGVARYSRELMAALVAAGVDVRPFAIGRGPGVIPPGCHHLPVPLRVVTAAWRRTRMPRAEWLAGGGQVVHSLDLVLPPSRLPLVATVHDLAALDRPDLHPPRAAEQLRRRLAELDRADVVVAVSQATATALARHGVDPARVVVTYQATTLTPEGIDGLQVPRRRPFLLAVGEITARKDYATIVRAMACEPLRDLDLIIAGPMGYRHEDVLRLISALRLENRVLLLGRVSDAELADLYRDAELFCFSSVIEGFGIPLLEAMHAGLPIVCSDIDVAHEVAGDAAVYVPVGDFEGFASQVSTVLGDSTLRSDLAAAGRARSALFSWQRTAALTIEAYRNALGAA
ncbi:MAG TPA: glycosyltransferase family 1 protein [Mycobacteriales bacterium]|nr:glycosyltransferase family 1 protein [Mycobacteriales bacterium]